MRSVFALLMLACAAVMGDEARVFFHKSTATSPVVQNQEFVISYKVTNEGEGAAYNIEITDRYDQNDFDLKTHEAIDNVITLTIPEVRAHETQEVNVTVVPRKFGGYVPTLARIKYSGGADRILDASVDVDAEDVEVDLDEDGDEIDDSAETGTIGYSTSLGRLEIVEEALWLRQSTNSVWTAWMLFLASAAVLILVPRSQAAAAKSQRIKRQ